MCKAGTYRSIYRVISFVLLMVFTFNVFASSIQLTFSDSPIELIEELIDTDSEPENDTDEMDFDEVYDFNTSFIYLDNFTSIDLTTHIYSELLLNWKSRTQEVASPPPRF